MLYMYENAFQYAQMGYALSIAFVLFVALIGAGARHDEVPPYR